MELLLRYRPWKCQCNRRNLRDAKNHGHRVDDMIIKEPVAMKIAFGENLRGYITARRSHLLQNGWRATKETLYKAKTYLERRKTRSN